MRGYKEEIQQVTKRLLEQEMVKVLLGYRNGTVAKSVHLDS